MIEKVDTDDDDDDDYYGKWERIIVSERDKNLKMSNHVCHDYSLGHS